MYTARHTARRAYPNIGMRIPTLEHMPHPTALTQAVETVEEFATGWLDQSGTVQDLADHWGVAPSTARKLAFRLNLPARKRGAKRRIPEKYLNSSSLNSPSVLTNGRWIGRRGIVHWVPGH